jgi:hypothetical protein
MYCKTCGNKLPEGARFCGKCGTKVINENVHAENVRNEKNEKNKVQFGSAAIILGIIFVILVSGCFIRKAVKNREAYTEEKSIAKEQRENIKDVETGTDSNNVSEDFIDSKDIEAGTDSNNVNENLTESAAQEQEQSEPPLDISTYKQAEVGDIVNFGSYEQDNKEGNGQEPIQWIVIEKNSSTILLLSRYIIDYKPYDEDAEFGEYVTWSQCSLRTWLNGEFYNTAFGEKERERIETTRLATISLYSFYDEPETNDKIFVFSISDIDNYKSSVEEQLSTAQGTAYAMAQGLKVGTVHGHANSAGWWLRSPGYRNANAQTMSEGVYESLEMGESPRDSNRGVRPALWLNIQ